jgi:toxin ParE1/3/4
MKVIIHESAEDDLDRILEWIAKDNRSAAARIVAKIRDRINLLEIDSLAKMGRPGFVAATRELIEYPYISVRRR